MYEIKGRTYGVVASFGDDGVQIMDVTDPARPVPVSAAFDGAGGFSALSGASDVEVFDMDGRTYAVVTGQYEHDVQIMDVTDPARPEPVSGAFDGAKGFSALLEASDVELYEIKGRTYGVVASFGDDGVQIMDVTDPARPVPVSAAFDGAGGFDTLRGANDVEVFGMDGRTYGVVAARYEYGVQIMDVTDPARPVPVSTAVDGTGGFRALSGASDVEVFGVDGRTYGVVAARYDNGVQIMDVTDPARPVPVSAAFDGAGGFYALRGANDVEVFGMDGRTYGVVASLGNDGVQIMDVTDPARPVPVSAAFDGAGGFDALQGASDVEVYEVGGPDVLHRGGSGR